MLRLLTALGAVALILSSGAAAQQARKAPAAKPAPRPAAAPNWLAAVTITPQGGFRQGNPDAPVKLVEYGSRTCPTCTEFARTGMDPLRRDYVATGKVSYEYRDYLVHGAPDFALALLNQCVPTARFFPVLDAIYANQPVFEARLEKLLQDRSSDVEAWQKLKPYQAAAHFAEALGMIAFMKIQGLPEARARQCLADPKIINRIAQTYADGAKVHGVGGTPTFIVNARKVRASSWERLQPELWANGADAP